MKKNRFKEEILSLAKIKNPLVRKGEFLALLNRELNKKGAGPLYVVGGFAVEIYTAGNYVTGDLDIKGPKKEIEELLLGIGFTKIDSTFGSKKLDIYIDWLGEGPEYPYEDKDRFVEIQVRSGGLSIRVISCEDIILDRLRSAKFWKDADALLWAEAIAEAIEESGQKLDWAYLAKRAQDDDTLDFLQKLKK